MSCSKPFCFLSLPPEIRNMIYELAVKPETIATSCYLHYRKWRGEELQASNNGRQHRGEPGANSRSLEKRGMVPSLALACKQTYSELMLLHFRKTSHYVCLHQLSQSVFVKKILASSSNMPKSLTDRGPTFYFAIPSENRAESDTGQIDVLPLLHLYGTIRQLKFTFHEPWTRDSPLQMLFSRSRTSLLRYMRKHPGEILAVLTEYCTINKFNLSFSRRDSPVWMKELCRVLHFERRDDYRYAAVALDQLRDKNQELLEAMEGRNHKYHLNIVFPILYLPVIEMAVFIHPP